MRQVGVIDNELDAHIFRDYLYNRDIECDVEKTSAGAWSVWVHDEDKLAAVIALFAEFQANPDDLKYIDGSEGAAAKRAARKKEEQTLALKEKQRAPVSELFGMGDVGRVTWGLLAISVTVTLLIQFGANKDVFRVLMISEYPFLPAMNVILPEVQAGQIWRLITPVFMHLGIIHLLFNMLWLKDLGGMIERIERGRFVLLFVLLTGLLSNLGQYLVSGPAFGGMSGVIYGMLGYVWVQSRLNPWGGYVMHSFTFNMMMVWFVLCLSGFMGPVANTTHGVGLVVGVLWGYLNARRQV